MKRNKRMLCLTTALLGIAVFLAGCAGQAAVPVEEPTATATTAAAVTVPPAEKETTAPPPAEPAEEPQPQRFEETIDGEFRVDASVFQCPEGGLAGMYVGQPQRFTQAQIDAFLSALGTSCTAATEKTDASNTLIYKGSCDNGASFSVERPNSDHPHYAFLYGDRSKYGQYYDYPIYYGEESFLTNPKYTVGWLFTEPKDFAFGTAAEAEQDIRNALKTLGITDLELLRTLYVDHKTQEAAMKRVIGNPDYAPIGDFQPHNGYPIREDWSEDNDAYVFSFGFSVQGVPMSYRTGVLGNDEYYCGSEIVVWYNKDGIVFLHLEMPWEVTEEAQPPVPVIPAVDALETAKVKFAALPDHYRDKCIEEVRLEYQYTREGDRWLLKPVWAVAMSYTDDAFYVRYYQFMNIDALTGNEL